jgi:hypothetical protein
MQSTEQTPNLFNPQNFIIAITTIVNGVNFKELPQNLKTQIQQELDKLDPEKLKNAYIKIDTEIAAKFYEALKILDSTDLKGMTPSMQALFKGFIRDLCQNNNLTKANLEKSFVNVVALQLILYCTMSINPSFIIPARIVAGLVVLNNLSLRTEE